MNNPVTFGALNYGILFTYLSVMFAIGLLVARKQKTTKDYFLAGGSVLFYLSRLGILQIVPEYLNYSIVLFPRQTLLDYRLLV